MAGPSYLLKTSWAGQAAPCCVALEPAVTSQGDILAQYMLPIKFYRVKHYSGWQL